MSSLIDDIVVGMLVLGAIAYAATTLGPRTWRGGALATVARVLERVPATFGVRGLARRLGDKAAANSGGACGGCDTCGSDTAKNSAGTLGDAPDAGSHEVRIPLSKIGKRS